jgi:CRISPR-associated protein Csy1
MTTSNPRQAALRLLISEFLSERLNGKLDKLKPDDPKCDEKRDELKRKFLPAFWLEDAATRRVGQIQAATHILKAIHPDAKGTSLHIPPNTLPKISFVGSHCLEANFINDVVGNAAVLDVYGFLQKEHEGQSLLALALAQDEDFAAALSDDVEEGRAWMNAFAGLIEPRGRPASHTLAKQLYWQVGADANTDESFHLLAPLYASALAHRVYEVWQDDRFREASKEERDAKKANAYSERPVHEYPNLAIQQLGGSNQQNVSYMNSKRQGQNLLFASLPPVWRSVELKPLLNSDSMYPRFARRPAVKTALRELLDFLKTDPTPNIHTRKRRAAWVAELTSEFLQFTAELNSLPAGWSLKPECQLPEFQARWLDPDGWAQKDEQDGRAPPTDVAERISASFADWLNGALKNPLPMGDPEWLEWKKVIWEDIKEEEREGNHVIE